MKKYTILVGFCLALPSASHAQDALTLKDVSPKHVAALTEKLELTLTVEGLPTKPACDCKVTVGDSECVGVRRMSDTTLTCVLPALEARVYDVTVTCGEETSAIPQALDSYRPLAVTPKTPAFEVGQFLQLLVDGGVPPYEFASNVRGCFVGTGYILQCDPRISQEYFPPAGYYELNLQVTDALGNATTYRTRIYKGLYSVVRSDYYNWGVEQHIPVGDTVQIEVGGGVPPFSAEVLEGDATASPNEGGFALTAGAKPGKIRIRVTDALEMRSETFTTAISSGIPDLRFGTKGRARLPYDGYWNRPMPKLATLGNDAIVVNRVDQGLMIIRYGQDGKVKLSRTYPFALEPTSLTVLLDGSLLVGGSLEGTKFARVAKFLENGDLDPSFGKGGVVDRKVGKYGILKVGSIVPRSDGRLWVTYGKCESYPSYKCEAKLELWDSKQQLDKLVNEKGKKVDHLEFDTVSAEILLSPIDGLEAYLIVNPDQHPTVRRILRDGAIAAPFQGPGKGVIPMRPDGKYCHVSDLKTLLPSKTALVVSYCYVDRGGGGDNWVQLSRMSYDAVESPFLTEDLKIMMSNGDRTMAAIQADGRVLVAQDMRMSPVDHDWRLGMTRYTSEGKVDLGFGVQGCRLGAYWYETGPVAVAADGAIYQIVGRGDYEVKLDLVRIAP